MFIRVNCAYHASLAIFFPIFFFLGGGLSGRNGNALAGRRRALAGTVHCRLRGGLVLHDCLSVSTKKSENDCTCTSSSYFFVLILHFVIRRAHRHTNLLAEEQLHRRNFQVLQEDARLAFLYEVASLCYHSYQSDPYELEHSAFSCHGLWMLAHRDGCHAGLHVEDDEADEKEEGDEERSEVGVASKGTQEGFEERMDGNTPAGEAPNPSGGNSSSATAATKSAATKHSVKAPLPTFMVLARDQPQKIAFVVVRGTQNLSDCLIDVQAMPRPLYLPKGTKPHERNDGEGYGDDSASMNGNPSNEDRINEGGTSSSKSVRYWVHGGMANAASWVEAEIGPLLLQLAAHQYRIVLCGHSLGAGVTSLLHARLTSKHASLAHVECVGMGMPPMVDPVLGQRTRQASFHASRNSGSSSGGGSGGGKDNKSESASAKVPAGSNAAWLDNAYAGTVTAVVNRDDLVCRASAANARLLVRDLQGGDAHWQGSFAADKQVRVRDCDVIVWE